MAPTVADAVSHTTTRDRIVDAVGRATHLAHEARLLNALASDAIEDGVHAAKRAATRGAHRCEDLRDAAAYRVKKAPLMAVAVAAGAGLLFGMVVGRMSRCARQ